HVFAAARRPGVRGKERGCTQLSKASSANQTRIETVLTSPTVTAELVVKGEVVQLEDVDLLGRS
ncbi:hypothetical protein GBAR_LOCUS16691, partial [Geodia barretti]